MFSSVSWSHYINTLLVATVFYYLLIWILVFKARIPALNRIGSIAGLSLHGEDSPDEMLSTAQHVMDELRPLFRRDASQHEMLYALQQQLKKYNAWDEPGFRDTVNSFILGEFQTTCSIRLREDDLKSLWK